MTVEEMLSRISSHELTEWMAYERATGPLGRQYSDEMLAKMHELLQALLYYTGAQFKENPAPKPQKIPRPPDVMKPEMSAEYSTDISELARIVPEKGS